MIEDEGSLGKTKRTGDEADLDITPMIDVTFLLLIFFMVTSTMQGTPEVSVPPARHGASADTTTATTVDIKAPDGAGGDPVILLDGEPSSIEQVKAKVQEGIDSPEPKNRVIIMADREVPHGFVQQVAKAVVEFEGVTFSIGVTDKK